MGTRGLRAGIMKASDAKPGGAQRFWSLRAATRADLVVVHGHIELVVEFERLVPEHTPEPQCVAAVHLCHLRGHVQDVGAPAERTHVLACRERGQTWRAPSLLGGTASLVNRMGGPDLWKLCSQVEITPTQSSAHLGLGRCPAQVLLREHPASLPSAEEAAPGEAQEASGPVGTFL